MAVPAPRSGCSFNSCHATAFAHMAYMHARRRHGPDASFAEVLATLFSRHAIALTSQQGSFHELLWRRNKVVFMNPIDLPLFVKRPGVGPTRNSSAIKLSFVCYCIAERVQPTLGDKQPFGFVLICWRMSAADFITHRTSMTLPPAFFLSLSTICALLCSAAQPPLDMCGGTATLDGSGSVYVSSHLVANSVIQLGFTMLEVRMTR